MNKYRYIGFFVSQQEVLRCALLINGEKRLSRVIEHPHITLAYMPVDANESLFGQIAEITLVGYANDGMNEGFLVEVSSACSELDSMLKAVSVPHITVSVSEDSKAVETADLNFEPIKPIKINGVFGGFTHNKNVVTEIV